MTTKESQTTTARISQSLLSSNTMSKRDNASYTFCFLLYLDELKQIENQIICLQMWCREKCVWWGITSKATTLCEASKRDRTNSKLNITICCPPHPSPPRKRVGRCMWGFINTSLPSRFPTTKVKWQICALNHNSIYCNTEQSSPSFFCVNYCT